MEKQCTQCEKSKELKWFNMSRSGKRTGTSTVYKKICKQCEAENRGDRKVKEVIYDMSETDKAYIAGLFDGEGHVGLYGRNRKSTENSRRGAQGSSYNLRVQVTSTDRLIIDWLVSKFKGLSYSSTWDNRKNDDPGRDVNTWKDTHQFLLTSRNAEGFLKCILPYLIIKKERAELGIEFMTLMGYSGMDLPEELIKQRFEIINKMKSLNKRGKIMFGDNIRFGDGSTFTPGPGLNMQQGIALPEDENGNRKIVWEDREEYEKQKKSSELGKVFIQQEDFMRQERHQSIHLQEGAGKVNLSDMVKSEALSFTVVDNPIRRDDGSYVYKVLPASLEEANKLNECESIVYDIAKKKIMEKIETDKTKELNEIGNLVRLILLERDKERVTTMKINTKLSKYEATIELLKQILSDIKTVCENSIITVKYPNALYNKTHYMEYVIDKLQKLIDANTDI